MKKVKEWISENMDFEKELIEMRRYLHANPEVGSVLPVTTDFIVRKLKEFGYSPRINKNGSIYVLAGKKEGKVLLVRVDMDGLPIQENTDLYFKSINGNMHACGHDLHTTIGLGLAKLLKEKEAELNGSVKLVFQPHEEGLVGALKMIEDGIMENPHVDAAMGLHVLLGTKEDTGTIAAFPKEMTAASTIFEIEVQGKQAHGSMPEEGIDALRTSVHIYNAMQELIPKEIHMHHSNVLTVGILQAGTAHNIIPDSAYMKCSLRCFNNKDQNYLLKRIQEVVNLTCTLYGAKGKVHVLQSTPSVFNSFEFMHEIYQFEKPIFEEALKTMDTPLSVSEDFARISQLVPSLFVTCAAGKVSDGYIYGHHNECAIFDEKCMMSGVYFLFTSAMQWLNM